MGGLSSALALAKKGFKDVQVFETASNLGFVGAGIQLAPNMARILDRLGVWDEIAAEAVILKNTSIRQGASDEELGFVDLNYIAETYKYPHCVGHRASLANALYNGCKKESAITFHFSTSIVDVISWSPTPTFTVQPRNGEQYTIECDILLGADGIKSRVRSGLLKKLNHTAAVVDSGQAAYRIMLTREQMSKSPRAKEMLELLDSESVRRWIGPRKHIIAYPVSSHQIYNLSTAQPDTNFAVAPTETYTTKGSKKDMMEIYSDFNPLIKEMLDLVPEGEVCEWKLRVHEPLPTWIEGSVALIGDACHPTLPHLAQGAAQAIEDSAVIAEVLALLPSYSPEDINKALKVYEEVRKERAEILVEMAAQSGRTLHLGEGKAKEERDRLFEELKKAGKQGAKVPDKWADAEVQKMIYGFDCMEVAKEMAGKVFKKTQ